MPEPLVQALTSLFPVQSERPVATSDEVTLYVCDLHPLRVVFNTRPIAAMLGYSAATHPAMTLDTVHELMHPDDLPRMAVHIGRLYTLPDGGIAEFRHRMLAATGEWAWIEVRDAVLRRDAAGVPQQVIGTAREVTAQMQAQEALRASEARHRLLAETMLQGVVHHAQDGTIIAMNPAAERLLGRPRDAMLGSAPDQEERHTIREDGSLFPGADHPASVSLRTGQPVHGVIMGVYNWEEQEYRWLRVDAVPLTRRGEPQPYEVYTVFEDVTQQRRAELALRDAHTRKDHFIATLAHELRNPLAPIRNAVSVLRIKGYDDPEMVWCQSVIDRQITHMARLLDDLLDASRISSGKLDLRRERVSLPQVLAQAMEIARPLLDAARHSLTVRLAEPVAVLDGDLVRLAQVFGNLLTNAAKYTEPGGEITITSEHADGEVTVRVRDTGIGIDAAHLPRIFEMFGQVESALERSQGGLGIGLSLAQALVEMHGGRVTARSEGRGTGTEFVVCLPLSSEQPSAVVPVNPAPLPAVPARRILVVDDNRDGADTLAAVLRLRGFEMETAYDGEAALAGTARFNPDVVLLDIGLPVLNGYDVCEALRSRKGGEAMLIIAVTGWGSTPDLAQAMRAGFDAHFVKPVDMDRLAQLLPLTRGEARLVVASQRPRQQG